MKKIKTLKVEGLIGEVVSSLSLECLSTGPRKVVGVGVPVGREESWMR